MSFSEEPDTICDCCGDTISDNELQFHMEGVGTVCGNCYDEYCTAAFQDDND